MLKHHIMISACLIGEKVRYDGRNKLIDDPIIQSWQKQKLLIPICPEVSGGLSIPRPPAEIKIVRVESERLKPFSHLNTKHTYNAPPSFTVITQENIDVTQEFERGAQLALQKCLDNNIQLAILTEGSPSCGSQLVNDGSFQSRKISGQGVTTALLRKNNVKVFNQYQLQQADDFYQQLTIKRENNEQRRNAHDR